MVPHRRAPAPATDRDASFGQAALLDAAHAAYADWLEESFAVAQLYAHWRDATRRAMRGGLAFGAYAAGLEREERAAQVYADMVRMAAPVPPFVSTRRRPRRLSERLLRSPEEAVTGGVRTRSATPHRLLSLIAQTTRACRGAPPGADRAVLGVSAR